MIYFYFAESFWGFKVSARIFVSARWNKRVWNCETNINCYGKSDDLLFFSYLLLNTFSLPLISTRKLLSLKRIPWEIFFRTDIYVTEMFLPESLWIFNLLIIDSIFKLKALHPFDCMFGQCATSIYHNCCVS